MSVEGKGIINNALVEINKISVNHYTLLLTATQRDVCKTLRNNEEIIRKSDKSNIKFNVILHCEDYK